MNKRAVDKAMLLLSALKSRMEENKDFFEKIRVTLRSGTREYFAEFTYENSDIFFEYLGEKNK